MVKLHVNPDVLTALVSVAVQVPLAMFLGQAYDQTSFLDAGFLVNQGLNPYLPHVVTVFSPLMVGINPIIGDPPLWPLLLGAIYRITYNVVPNIFLYNFATKIPVIASNVGLAYFTRNILRQQGASEGKIRFAWLFLLFNPFVLLTSAAWGQFDALIALLCVVSLYLLSRGMIKGSTILLSLSVALKPVAFPLLALPLLFSPTKNWRKMVQYIVVSAVAIVSLWILPFYLFGWTLPASNGQITSFFTRAGGMTPFDIVEILSDTVTIPNGFAVLGYIWIPALLLCYYLVYRDPPETFIDLTQKGLGIMLVFFLTYSWLSEPYIIAVLALALFALPLPKLNFRNFHFLWIIALIFMVLTTNFTQLFYLISPQSLVSSALQIYDNIRSWVLIARFFVVVAWQVFAWMLALKLLLSKKIKQKNRLRE